MKYAVVFDNKNYILGNSLATIRDFFTHPMNSSSLGIYVSNANLNTTALYSLENIEAKMVCLSYKTEYVFIPLLHTYK